MKITILGSASGMADLKRSPSAYCIEIENHIFLIEAGEGTARQMLRYDKDPLLIDAVFITHTHADHSSGLFFLLQWMHLKGRERNLDIYLPEGLLPGFAMVFPYFQIFTEKWPFQFTLKPLRHGKVTEIDSFWLEGILNNHLMGNKPFAQKRGIGIDSYSLCFGEKEKRILYTSDVSNLKHLDKKYDTLDLFICEWAHITLESIHDFIQTTKTKQTVLTHISPEQDEMSLPENELNYKQFINIAEDGMIIEV